MALGENKMTLQQLASAIAKREGKKSQSRIGDIREILKILIELDAQDLFESDGKDQSDGPLEVLMDYSDKRYLQLEKKKAKKK